MDSEAGSGQFKNKRHHEHYGITTLFGRFRRSLFKNAKANVTSVIWEGGCSLRVLSLVSVIRCSEINGVVVSYNHTTNLCLLGRCVPDVHSDGVRRQRVPAAVSRLLGGRRPQHQPSLLGLGLRDRCLCVRLPVWRLPDLAGRTQGPGRHLKVCVCYRSASVSRFKHYIFKMMHNPCERKTFVSFAPSSCSVLNGYQPLVDPDALSRIFIWVPSDPSKLRTPERQTPGQDRGYPLLAPILNP